MAFYLNNRVFLSRNFGLIVAPRKFDVLKTNICPRSEASRAKMLVLRTSSFQGAMQLSDRYGNRELTLKCKLKCYEKPMKDPLGVSPSKGNQGTTRGKEKFLLTSVGIEPTTSGLDLPSLCRLSYEVGQRKSSPTFSVRPRSSVGRVTVDLIRRSWVRFPPRSKEIFLYLVWFPDSLY